MEPIIFETFELTDEKPILPIFDYSPELQVEFLHYHDVFEIGYCREGFGSFNIEGKIIAFNAPCCSMIDRGNVHFSHRTTLSKPVWDFAYVDLVKLFKGFDSSLLIPLNMLDFSIYSCESIFLASDFQDFCDISKEIFKELRNNSIDSLNVVRGLIYALLIKRMRVMKLMTSSEVKITKNTFDEIKTAIDYIENNYSKDITTTEIAKLCNMSIATVNRKFISFTSMSPMEYVHNIRMRNAATLIAQKKLTINEISSKVGYPTISSFNRHFYAFFQKTPTEWRKGKVSK